MKAWIAVLLMFLTFSIVAMLSGGAVWYWQNTVIDRLESEYVQKEATLNAKFEKQESELSDLQTEVATSKSVLEEQETMLKTLPLLFYTPAGQFTEAEKRELKKQVFDPYVDYYADQGMDVVTMDVQTHEGDGDFLYIIDAYLSDGSHNGFLWGTADAASLWWIPECMDECEFTEEFRKKYPEIIDAYESSP